MMFGRPTERDANRVEGIVNFDLNASKSRLQTYGGLDLSGRSVIGANDSSKPMQSVSEAAAS